MCVYICICIFECVCTCLYIYIYITLVDLKLFYPQKADTTQHCQTHPNFSTGNSQGIVWMCSMICWDQVLEVKFFYINMYVSKKYCFYVCYLYV